MTALQDHRTSGTEPQIEVLIREARRRRRRRRVMIGLVVIAFAVCVLVLWARAGDGSRASRSRARSGSSAAGLFDEKTGAVLLLSDGIDGVTAIDVDHRIAGRRVIAGERAGDQEYRITTTGDQLIVGWGQIYAFPLTRGPSRKIADATTYVPAAEPGQVWTTTWEGGVTGAGRSTVQRITTDGKVVFSSTALPTTDYPLLGVPDGLVVQTSDGPAIWNSATAAIGPTLGPGRPAASITSNGKTVAWCNNTCIDVHVVPLTATGPTTAQHAGMQQLALSNDNQRVAYLRPVGDEHAELVVRDVTSGSETTIATDLSVYGSIAWSTDSRQLFYSEPSYGMISMHLGHYSIDTGRWEYHDIPFGGAVSGIVIVSPSDARRFFNTKLAQPGSCPGAGMMYPSGRHGICSFHF